MLGPRQGSGVCEERGRLQEAGGTEPPGLGGTRRTLALTLTLKKVYDLRWYEEQCER